MLASSTLRTLTRFSDWAGEERHLPGPPWPLSTILLAVIVVSPIPLVALALEEVTAVFWLVLISDLVLLFGVAVGTFRTPSLFIGIMVLWFALQRLVVALVAPHVSADLVRLLLTYKEGFYLILVASGALSVFMRHFRGERALPIVLAVDMIALAFLAWLALVFIADPQSSSAELTYLRRFAAPVLLYLGGRMLIARRDQLIDSARLLLAVAVAVAAFGLIERFVFDITFWRDTVEASTFYGKQVESGLLPQNWTVIYRGVPDGIFIAMPLGEPVRRLVSTYLEPTTLSSLLALALLLLVLVPDLAWRRGRPLTSGLVALAAFSLGVAIVATLSRGGMVTFLAGTLFVLGARWLRSPGRQLSVPQPLLLLPLVVLIGLGAAITTFASVPGRESIRDGLATRAVSGLSDEPAPSAPQPSVPAEASPPLPEIEVHPPCSTADAASKRRPLCCPAGGPESPEAAGWFRQVAAVVLPTEQARPKDPTQLEWKAHP